MALLKDSLVAGDLRVTGTIYGDVPLDDLVDADDLRAIEALSGTSGTLVKTAANTWALSDQVAPSSHTHGNLTNEGKIGNTANYSIVTTTGGAIDAVSLAVNDPSANGTATAFIDSISQATNGKITASKKNLPTANTSTAGIVKLNDTVTGTSTTEAATANAVKTAYDIGAAAIPKSIGTETGDLIYWSANATPTKLAIGETDQVLKVVNGIPTWTTDTAQEGVNDLIEAETVEEQEPYIFRQSGGNKNANIGNREEDTIVGGTIAWNQLANLTAPLTKTFTESASYSGSLGNLAKVVNATKDHVYFVAVNVERTIATNDKLSMIFGGSSAGISVTYENGEANGVKSSLKKASATSSTASCTYSNYSGKNGFEAGDSITLNQVQIFDFTQMFGSTVADAVYAMEQANAGSGVAWFKAMYPLDYYAYNIGELKSVEGLVSHDMVGFNQWDEEWELGSISYTTGENETSSSRIRSKNYIPVIAGAKYYIFHPAANTRVMYYDANKTFIQASATFSLSKEFTIPDNTRYLRFWQTGTTYNNDICINLSSDRNGEYESYVKHSYLLDSTLTLRGIPKWDTDGMYYDGDTYEADGTVTRKYGVVDLGTLSWTNYKSGGFSSSVVPNIIVRSSETNGGICTKYNRRAYTVTLSSGEFCITGNRIYIVDSAFDTDATAFKTAMSGVYFVYELATPTTEQAEPFASSQIVDKYGTEEYVTTNIVPVGHKTLYQNVLSGKMSYLPDLAENDGIYLIEQKNNKMDLISASSLINDVNELKNNYNFLTEEEPEVITDKGAYLFRKSKGEDRELNKIIGGTIVWNQLRNTSTLTLTPNGAHTYYMVAYSSTAIINHVYYVGLTASGYSGSLSSIRVFLQSGASTNYGYFGNYLKRDMLPNESLRYEGFIKASASTTYVGLTNMVSNANLTSTDAVSLKDCILIDLTRLFGVQIAETMYTTAQQSSDNRLAVINQFKSYFPNNYYDYDPGSIQSVSNLTAHKMVGFNLWDGQIRSGYFDSAGNWQTGAGGLVSSVNPIRVLPNTTYYIRWEGTGNGYITEWTEPVLSGQQPPTGTFIRRNTMTPGSSHTITTKENCCYIHFNMGAPYANEGKDICINFSDPDKNGTYKPYDGHVYPLDSSLTLRGMPNLDTDGNLYFDGDRYDPDGIVTRKYDEVDLGTLTWNRDPSVENDYYASVPNAKGFFGVNGNTELCSKYTRNTSSSWDGLDKVCRFGASSANINVKDSAFANMTTQQVKEYLSGVMLVYELATPTTEQAAPYSNSQIVSKDGTEEYVTTNIIPVGHETIYSNSSSGKLNYLPNLGDGDGTYIIKQQDNQMSLTKFGDYVEKAGDTMTGYLTISNSGNAKLQLKDTNSNGEMFIGFGAAHQNHGIYSYGYAPTTSTWTDDAKWMVYRSASGAITLNGNATSATGFASAKSIALTGNVTGSASGGNGSNGWSIATTIGSGVVTNTMLAGSIANEKLVNSKVTIAGNDVSLGGSLTAATLKTSLGLNSAMHYIGKATVAITDGSTTDPKIGGNATTLVSGDVVIDSTDSREYVWNGSQWELLGGDSSYALSDHTHGKITNDGKIASTDNVTIANNDRLVISDASDSNILKNTSIVFDGSTATKALTQKGTWETFNNYSLPLAASGTRGGIQIGYSSSGQNYAVQLSSEKAYVNVPWTDTQQNITLKTTTKGYITAVETAPTSTTAAQTAIADTGVYLTTTAGEINAVQYKINEKSYISYDTTVDAIGFTFI